MVKIKRLCSLLLLVLPFFLICCASTSSYDNQFSVIEKTQSYSGATSYVYKLNGTPGKYKQFVDTTVYYQRSESSISNTFPYSCKLQVENALNNKQFTIKKVVWGDGKIILLLSLPEVAD